MKPPNAANRGCACGGALGSGRLSVSGDQARMTEKPRPADVHRGEVGAEEPLPGAPEGVEQGTGDLARRAVVVGGEVPGPDGGVQGEAFLDGTRALDAGVVGDVLVQVEDLAQAFTSGTSAPAAQPVLDRGPAA